MKHADRPEYMILAHTRRDWTLVSRDYADTLTDAQNYAGRGSIYGWSVQIYQLTSPYSGNTPGTYRKVRALS